MNFQLILPLSPAIAGGYGGLVVAACEASVVSPSTLIIDPSLIFLCIICARCDWGDCRSWRKFQNPVCPSLPSSAYLIHSRLQCRSKLALATIRAMIKTQLWRHLTTLIVVHKMLTLTRETLVEEVHGKWVSRRWRVSGGRLRRAKYGRRCCVHSWSVRAWRVDL